MALHFKRIATLGLVAVALVGGISAAGARSDRDRRPSSWPLCQERVTATATGQGVFGAGTRNARAAAIANFERQAETRYGSRYAAFGNARAVSWDCKKGAILMAKCVLTARPCR
ncbi:MAG: hypothetical protein ACRCS9_06840 [Hyphomicrobium sp.]